jgi:hypothetical protein
MYPGASCVVIAEGQQVRDTPVPTAIATTRLSLRRLEASLRRFHARVLDNAFLFLCPFEKLIEFLASDGGNVAEADPQSLFARDADNESFQFKQIAQRRTAQDSPVQLQATHTFSDARERVLRAIGLHPQPVHDALQCDEVFPDFGRDTPQIVVSGVALGRERNTPGDSGARGTRSMVIPQIDREQGTHSLALPSETRTKTSS